MNFNSAPVGHALAVALLMVLSLSSAALADTRNVLLIIADDQGLDLGVYGNPVLRTPNLDQLAARGTLFANAFATVSSCSPSRSVIYTGVFSHSNGMYGLAHDVHNQHLSVLGSHSAADAQGRGLPDRAGR